MRKLILKREARKLLLKSAVEVLNADPVAILATANFEDEALLNALLTNETFTTPQLSIDFDISTYQTDDETDVIFTATGDAADNFIWFDVDANVAIGRGNPLVTKIETGYGLRTIELRVTNEFSSLMGSITKEDIIDVTIKEVDDFFNRVDIILNELSLVYDYTQDRAAVDKAIFALKRNRFQSIRTFYAIYPLIYFCIPACPEVAVLSFFEYPFLPSDQTADGLIINGGNISGNYYTTNGIDQGVFIGCDISKLRPVGSQIWIHHLGRGSASDANLLGAQSNNNSRHTWFRAYSNYVWAQIQSDNTAFDYTFNIATERGHSILGTLALVTKASRDSIALQTRVYTSSDYNNPVSTRDISDPITNVFFNQTWAGFVGYAGYGSSYLNPTFAETPYVEWGGTIWGDFRPSTDEAIKELCEIFDQYFKDMGRTNEWD